MDVNRTNAFGWLEMSLSELLGEPELNEFQKAFYSGDAKRIKEVSEQFKTSKEQTLFKIIDELTVGKKRMIVDEMEDYDQNMINTALSQYPDLAYYAFEMNKFINGERKESISNQMHYDYLLSSIRRAKRPRVKWAKSYSDEDKLIIACIGELYELSERKSAEYYREFNQETINKIKKRSKAFACNEEFLKMKFNLPKNAIAELQSIANKW